MAVDCISYAAAYSSMKLAEHEGLPPEINILLSLGIGITATKVAGKYLLKDAKGAVIGEIHEHPAGKIGSTVDDVLSAERQAQKDIIDSVENGQRKLETNLQKGNYGEVKMDNLFESQGYDRISIDRVTDLNTPTHRGIDGVYYKSGPPPQYIIGEAKYGSSNLSTLSDGTRQMSNKWIQNRIEEAMGEDAYNQYLSDKVIYPDCEKDELVNIGSDYSIKSSDLNNGKIVY